MPQLDRQKRIEAYGSPTFQDQPAPAAGSKAMLSPNPSDPEAKYLPFDQLVVINNDNVDVKIRLQDEDDRSILVPANVTRTLSTPDIQPYHILSVENLDGSNAVTAGELTIERSRKGTGADDQARRHFLQSPLQRIVQKFTGLGGV